jgi:hypothetical protein
MYFSLWYVPSVAFGTSSLIGVRNRYAELQTCNLQLFWYVPSTLIGTACLAAYTLYRRIQQHASRTATSVNIDETQVLEIGSWQRRMAFLVLAR